MFRKVYYRIRGWVAYPWEARRVSRRLAEVRRAPGRGGW